MSKITLNNTLIIGLGLIGGSFAKALKKSSSNFKIFANDLDENSLKQAKDLRVIDEIFNLENDFSHFDLIVIATPLSFYKEILEKISKSVKKSTIIIDLGSAKSFITKILPKNLSENFVACHPIAGLEKNGFENSNENLFLNKKFIICNKGENANKISDLAIKIGSKPEFLDAKKHDEIYGLTSHLPQFISFLIKEFSPKNIKDDFFQKCFRLDDSAPEIWEDIFKFNQNNLEKFYIELFENFAQIIEDLEESRGENFIKNLKITSKPLDFDKVFFKENFAAIFFRALMVFSYLKIEKIKDYKELCGQGFKDFTLVANLLNYDEKELNSLLQKNYSKIIKIFNSIS